jgi:SRSO17 transposase
VGFATKPRIALGMVERAIAAGMPFAWVAADTVYGVGEVEMALRRAGKGYVLGVTGTHHVHSWGVLPPIAGTAAEIAKDLSLSAWRRLSAGEGTKGPRLHDWAYLELAHLEADEYVEGATGLWTRGLLARRHLADGELAFFTTWCPKGTPVEVLVAIEGRRWVIEDAFESAKNELGLDHNETRSWHGWHRHASLVMLAFAVLAVARHRANATSEQTSPCVSRRSARASDGRSRRSAASPRASPSAASAPRSSSRGQLGAAPTKPARDAHT